MIIDPAAFPTLFIVIAVKAYGSIAPTISPANYSGLKIFTLFNPVLVTKAPKRARATKQADPIAKPFPIAAVVLPAASSLSVIYLASPSSHISAIPPALSLIGPYASMVRAMQRVESIPRAPRATPYIPQSQKEKYIVMAKAIIGMMSDKKPRANP